MFSFMNNNKINPFESMNSNGMGSMASDSTNFLSKFNSDDFNNGDILRVFSGPRDAAEVAAKSNQGAIAEQRRQFDIAQEQQRPWTEAGVNALAQLQQMLSANDGINLPQFQPMAPNVPAYVGGQDFNYQGPGLPEFQTNAMINSFNGGTPQLQQFRGKPTLDRFNNAPQYQSTGGFNFDLQGDQGFQFAIDEAIKSATRGAAKSGHRLSGNVLAELNDRATGIASQYADQAFNRQLSQSRENYNRGLTDYQTNYGRARDINQLNNDITAQQHGINTGVHAMNNQTLQNQFGMDTAVNELQNRNVLAQLGIDQAKFAPNYQRASDMYDRALNEDKINYGRDITDHSIATQQNKDQYGRELGEHNLAMQHSKDKYNADQNYLNRLSALAGVGQANVANLNNLGAGTAGNIANLMSQSGQAQAAGIMGQSQNGFNALSLLAMLAMA